MVVIDLSSVTWILGDLPETIYWQNCQWFKTALQIPRRRTNRCFAIPGLVVYLRSLCQVRLSRSTFQILVPGQLIGSAKGKIREGQNKLSNNLDGFQRLSLIFFLVTPHSGILLVPRV